VRLHRTAVNGSNVEPPATRENPTRVRAAEFLHRDGLDMKRHSIAAILFLGAALTLGSAPASADESPYDVINAEAARTSVPLTPVGRNLTVLSGSGGNITVLAGPGGLVMVDAGIALSREKIASRLRALSPAPVRYVINTHWHWDHTDGNEWLHAAGATLLASPSTIRHLGETIRVEEWRHTFTPTPEGARPTIAVSAPKTIDIDGETVLIRPYGPGHTDGDLSVYFTHADVLATGDSFWNGQYPFMDYAAGGGIDGMIQQATQNVVWTTSTTVVVPGHGPVGRSSDLIAYRDMLIDVRARVAALKAKGLTLREVIAARPTAAHDGKWGKSVVGPALFVELVYRGV
jgi:glyoxylase-like metal-dependent hydrolase (beta-lactamase superfamily II)